MTTSKDVQGFEHDWLASDTEGRVALFSTAGGGYAPDAFIASIATFDEAIDAILLMPPISVATCTRELPDGLENTWKLIAERGFFAYDSDPLGGPYRLIAAPLNPVALANLPVPIRNVAGTIVLPSVAFKRAREITEEQIRKAHLT